MVAIRIYVEGGGDGPATLTKCRKGFSDFFRKVMPPRNMPKIIACGGRQKTFDRFRTAVCKYPDAFCVLLVDSEGPVRSGETSWAFLYGRDEWIKPDRASDDHAHLMVQLMESWFLADRKTLDQYFGQGFSSGSLPSRSDIDNIPKADVAKGLKAATKHTRTKGVYRKVHGFDILALIDPSAVAKASPDHAGRLIKTLVREANR